MADVTSQQIMSATGISNIVTLTRWHRMGLIPPPDVRTHPGGQGKMAYWPEWVLERCVRIKQLRKTGARLSKIKEILGGDWENEGRKYQRRRYRFAEANQQMERQAALVNLRETVEQTLRGWISFQQSRLRKTSVPFIASQIVDQAILLMEQGCNPVLVFDRGEVRVAPDFLVSQQLAGSRSLDRPLFVVPLFDVLQRYFRDLSTIPPKPIVRPSEKVLVSGPEGEHELRFVATHDWSFEIESTKAQRRRSRKAYPKEQSARSD